LILFIADGKVTNKFKRIFGIEQKFYSLERLKVKCVGILLFTMWSLFTVPLCWKLKISLDAMFGSGAVDVKRFCHWLKGGGVQRQTGSREVDDVIKMA